jgi:hypothetical protein
MRRKRRKKLQVISIVINSQTFSMKSRDEEFLTSNPLNVIFLGMMNSWKDNLRQIMSKKDAKCK